MTNIMQREKFKSTELFRFHGTWLEIQFREAHTSSWKCEERKSSKGKEGQGEGAPETFLP